jgi:hypothetical protein
MRTTAARGAIAALGAAAWLASSATSAMADQAVAPGVVQGAGDAAVSAIEGERARVAQELRAARVRKQGAKAVCANDALNRVDAALVRAREHAADAAAAAARSDADRVRLALGRLASDRALADGATHDVEACFAAERAVLEGTTVTLKIDSR